MRVKKVALALAVVGCSSAAMAYDVKLFVDGELVASTCKIDDGTAEQVKRVALPKVSTSSLRNAASFSGRMPVTFKISECETETSAAGVHFEIGGANITTAGTLTNNLTGPLAATNVSVQLLDQKTAVIDLRTSAGPSYVISKGEGLVQMFAQYYSADGGATAGKVESYVEFSMLYK